MKLILKLLFLSTVMASFGLAQSARRIPVTLPTQVSQPEMQALLIHKVDPVYPPLAHQARVQGTVVLQIVIDKSGSVVNLQLVSGHPMLAPAAIEAVKQWKYQPYTVDGSPVEVQTQVQVNFSLSNQPIVGVIGSVASGYALPPPTPGVPRAPEVVLRTLRIEKVDPLYPPNAIRDRIQGTVVLDVRIAASGSVENVSLLSGHPVLAPAAIEAVKQWRYKPYMVNGEPGPVESTVRLNFTISENDPQGSVNESSPEPKFPSPAPVPQRVRVSAAVSQGFVLKKVPPKYPAQARYDHIQGTVVLHAMIDKEGNVANVELISGHPDLAKAAIEAVRQWKYRPYLLNGEPVEVDTQIQVNFSLAQ